MPTFATFSPGLPNTVAGASLVGQGENVAKVGTILPLPYKNLSANVFGLFTLECTVEGTGTCTKMRFIYSSYSSRSSMAAFF